jgi:cation transport ATPase
MNDETVEWQDWREVMAIRGMGWRISASITSGLLWLTSLIAWLFFAATDHSMWENFGLGLISLLALVAINVAIWLPFGLRFAPKDERDHHYTLKGAVSGTICLSVATSLIAWLFLYADDFSIYQNLAVLLMFVIIGGGLNAVIWMGSHRTKHF